MPSITEGQLVFDFPRIGRHQSSMIGVSIASSFRRYAEAPRQSTSWLLRAAPAFGSSRLRITVNTAGQKPLNYLRRLPKKYGTVWLLWLRHVFTPMILGKNNWLPLHSFALDCGSCSILSSRSNIPGSSRE